MAHPVVAQEDPPNAYPLDSMKNLVNGSPTSSAGLELPGTT
jgi:hypothetical protein